MEMADCGAALLDFFYNFLIAVKEGQDLMDLPE
jgi:hypothetical protein